MYSIVAAIDWNWNTHRPSKLSKEGNPMYKCKVQVIFNLIIFNCLPPPQVDRTGKKTTAVLVKVPKDYSYQDSIFAECIFCLENDCIPSAEVYFPLLNLYF